MEDVFPSFLSYFLPPNLLPMFFLPGVSRYQQVGGQDIGHHARVVVSDIYHLTVENVTCSRPMLTHWTVSSVVEAMNRTRSWW